MLDLPVFLVALKRSMEAHSSTLKNGDLFLPQHLKEFTGAFSQVVATLARELGMPAPRAEVPNGFPDELEIGGNQRVDYVLDDPRTGQPFAFLELESLDGAQLMHFASHEGIDPRKDDYNKLWYYYGTVANAYSYGRPAPRYFVWILILPDRQVELCPGFTIWDSTREYGFFDKSLNQVVCQNPFRFYDHLIKAEAALFIMRQHELRDPDTGGWSKRHRR